MECWLILIAILIAHSLRPNWLIIKSIKFPLSKVSKLISQIGQNCLDSSEEMSQKPKPIPDDPKFQLPIRART